MLKLSQKAYLLVILPLMFQCIFIGVLFSLANQADVDTEREILARSVLSRVKTVGFSIWRAATYSEAYARSGDSSYRKKCRDSIQDIDDSLKYLRKLIESDPARMKRYKPLEQNVFAAKSILNTALKAADGGGEDWRMVSGTYYMRIKDIGSKLAGSIDVVMDDRLAAETEYTKARLQSRRNLKMGLIAGAVLTLLASLFCVVSISRGTLRRLNTVMRNIEGMRAGEQLLPPLSGSDELAIMDERFHSMSEAIRLHEKERKDLEDLRQRFFAMISHDMKVPLSSLKIFLDLIADKSYSADEIAERIGSQQTNVSRLVELVSDLIELEKVNSPNFSVEKTSVDVQQICDEALETVTHLASARGVQLDLDMNVSKVLQSDQRRLIQVLVNLLSNAIKFSDIGAKVVLNVRDDGDKITFQISDQGQGVPEHMRDAIFEPFSQVDSTSVGSAGLGLPICRAIVAAHGGTIGLTPREPKGSLFWFSLPLS